MPEPIDVADELQPETVAERVRAAGPGLRALLAEANATWAARAESTPEASPGWRAFEDAFPTFYQFTESIIEVKMAISTKSSSEFSLEVQAEGGFACFSASVDAKYSSSYSYSVDGSSLLRTTLKPVPPPARLVPRTVTVNTLTTPATVTIA